MAKLLIIGGSRFSGYYATQYALSRGHKVTLFNRGRSAPNNPDGVETVVGDRDKDLELLRGRQWDAVLDTCGFVPRMVRNSAELLAGTANHYTFISSISVFSETPAGYDENAPLSTLNDSTTEEITGETYGGLKALCERVVEDVFPGRALNIRPGLIVGPRDPTDRFNYWVRRVAQGGEVLAPATPDRPVQFIDARDLGQWLVRAMETGLTGTFNATGPATPYTMGEFLEACKAVTGSDATFTWVEEKFLLDRSVVPWQELPLWVPQDSATMHQANVSKAVSAGLTFRPLQETIQGAWDWMRAAPEKAAPQGSLKPEREQALLEEWHGQH